MFTNTVRSSWNSIKSKHVSTYSPIYVSSALQPRSIFMQIFVWIFQFKLEVVAGVKMIGKFGSSNSKNAFRKAVEINKAQSISSLIWRKERRTARLSCHEIFTKMFWAHGRRWGSALVLKVMTVAQQSLLMRFPFNWPSTSNHVCDLPLLSRHLQIKPSLANGEKQMQFRIFSFTRATTREETRVFAWGVAHFPIFGSRISIWSPRRLQREALKTLEATIRNQINCATLNVW